MSGFGSRPYRCSSRRVIRDAGRNRITATAPRLGKCAPGDAEPRAFFRKDYCDRLSHIVMSDGIQVNDFFVLLASLINIHAVGVQLYQVSPMILLIHENQ